MNRPYAPEVSIHRKFPVTHEAEALPTLGERPGLVLFPWRRLVVAGLGFLVVLVAVLLAR